MLYMRELSSDQGNIIAKLTFSPFVAGISGNPADGAWSVALSGGYADE